VTEFSEFEKMIARIHTLFERVGKIIRWDDKVFGAADPDRERQVDVTIKRKDAFVHVECRKHSKPQDVTWIEQLIGRKSTLKPDLIIAVSSSGFTQGAIKTAQANGIILRDLLTLTDKEIETWGSRVEVFVGYHRYEKPNLIFIFDPTESSRITPLMSWHIFNLHRYYLICFFSVRRISIAHTYLLAIVQIFSCSTSQISFV
jgi:hypothetical protein